MKSISCAAFALALAFPATSLAEPPAPAGAAQIVSSAFGIFQVDANNQPSFQPANVVPLIEKQSYGWIIQVKTDKATVHYREELSLPAAAKTWGTEGSADIKVGQDQRTSVTERDVTPKNGIILNVWNVAAGDPAGHYIIKVTVDGSGVRQFDFDVR